MEYHSFLRDCTWYDENSDTYVSVSLWSIIHSYEKNIQLKNLENQGFRLLMECHSFLF